MANIADGPLGQSTSGNIATRDDAERALGELRVLDRERSLVRDSLDLAICQAKQALEPRLNLLEAKFLERSMALENWARDYRSGDGKEIFEGKKSIKLLHGTIGFRWSKPALLLLARQKWDHVLERLRDKWPHYVRTKDEPNKAKILADATADSPLLSRSDLSEMGAKISQEENFYIEFDQA